MSPTSSPQKRRKRAARSAGSDFPLAPHQKRKRTVSPSTPPSSSKRVRVKTEETSPTEPEVAKSKITISDPIYGALVDFKIGESGTSFGIHRGLLCRASLLFKEQLSESEATEGSIITRSIELKDEDPEIFTRFNTWLYSEKIISESETYGNLPWQVIFDVYSFAERTGIPRLQNHCVDAVIRKRRSGGLFPGQANVNTLWKRSGDSYRLRKLLLDLFATGCNLSKAIANNGSFHPRFLQGLVQTLYEMKVRGTMRDQVNFWQKRHDYYVADQQNPISLD